MNNEIEQKVIEIASNVFNVDINAISKTDTKDIIEAWDSIGHLQLIMHLESAFDIKFMTSEIMNLKDIQGIIDNVTVLIKAK